MQYAPKKVFILEDGKYIEISYEEYQKLQKETKRRFLLVQGMFMEVSEEDYASINREESRKNYCKKLSVKYGEFSYDALTTEEFNGADILVDDKQEVLEIVEKNIIMDKLQTVLGMLTEEEQRLIRALFFDELTERDVAKRYGISQAAVHKRKKKIIKKMKELMER